MAKACPRRPTSVAHLYFGLGPSHGAAGRPPPAGPRRADAQLAAQKIAGWQKGLSESKGGWAQDGPVGGRALRQPRAPRAGATQHRRSSRSIEARQESQSVVNELLSAIFSVRWRARRRETWSQRAERIDTSRSRSTNRVSGRPPRLRSQRAVCRGRRADPGPFGLRVGELRPDRAPTSGSSWSSRASTAPSRTSTDDSRRARLFVDSVTSRRARSC